MRMLSGGQCEGDDYRLDERAHDGVLWVLLSALQFERASAAQLPCSVMIRMASVGKAARLICTTGNGTGGGNGGVHFGG